MLLQLEQQHSKQTIEVPVLQFFNLTDAFNVHVGPYAAYMVATTTTIRTCLPLKLN
jgi:hypothetical protein